MSILWFIIKLILFILLGILLLLLLILGIISLVPIRYEGYFAKYEEMAYEIKIRYLPGIKVDFDLNQGIKRHQVSIFGKRIYEVNKVPDSDKQKIEKDKDTKDRVGIDKKADKGHSAKKQTVQPASEQSKPITEEKKISLSDKSPMEEVTYKEEHRSVLEQESTQLEEEKHTTKDMEAKAEAINIKELLLDPLTYKAFKRLLGGIWQLIKIIGPREWDFEIVVGKEEPADTGEFIAKLTMLYPLYYKHGIIRGDYEKECLMGGFLVKGRFSLIQIVILLVRLYFNKDIHAFIRLIKK